jgi:nucleoside-diphosphate-sugar epimerase
MAGGERPAETASSRRSPSLSDRFLIFGAGYSGRAFSRLMAGHAEIAGTTRSPDRFALLSAAGIEPLAFEGERLSGTVRSALRDATHVIVSTAPGEAGDPVLTAGRDALLNATPALGWVGYLSTVGVYGDHQGAWVDEASETRPTSRRSQLRLAAEQAWIEYGRERGVPVAVLRLSGIYGPGRNAFVNLAKGTARRLVKPGQVFNRIHVEDIARALRHLAERRAGGVFNVSDDDPAPPQDVVAYAATLMGVTPPPELDFETAQISPITRSFYSENKRVSNARIKAAGFRFAFPDYRAALDRMWMAGDWAGSGEADQSSPINPS